MTEKKSPASRSTLAMLGAVLLAAAAAFQILLVGGDPAPSVGDRAETPPERPTATAAAGGAEVDWEGDAAALGEGPEGDFAAFDYYVLALSWSPSFCIERPDADQCGAGRRFILHGLWPNFETGYAADCDSLYDAPSAALLSRYADLSGGTGLLAYQWRKHGSCSGLEPEEYFETAKRAYAQVTPPPMLAELSETERFSAREIEAAFLQANPGMTADGVTVRCRDGRLQEVRICLTADLEPRRCGVEVARDCRAAELATPAPR